ncbi:glycoside hydrolase family 127 protein [Botrimarina mediterranea]|uniref:Non-reducing end beta-L-arabinofuranosidase n=1 Tax=Botrimarina mediterranea TaxID=2528022 RepID=A0A518K7W3_9BACT|nr:glycoside hydrolase family 127 protein [Botrimarina mediterranea]QDV73882.1 Non-reducing end beta-L-arabinofuranosidase [Botrimarina mediterranea]
MLRLIDRLHGVSSVLLLLAVAAPSLAAGPVKLFALDQVALMQGPLLDAAKGNRDHLLLHDADRMLAPYLEEAGLEPKAPRYPNWESTGLGGHTAGHYLSALACTGKSLDDQECLRRVDYMVSELARCQAASGDGYVGGVPDGRRMWEQVRRGDINAQPFSLNGRWVPLYNLHKTLAGLRDAYVIAGNGQAKQVLIDLVDWCEALVSDLSDEQVQQVLVTEHGGVNEVFADVAEITGEARYLKLAERFSHRTLLDPLASGVDQLDGMHANTQVPKVIGFERIAGLDGPARMHDAADFFWRTVAHRRSIAFGGNSVSEHFPSSSRSLDYITSREGPETCNTYNMLRLSEELFKANPRAEYADFYERAVYNHILSARHPRHGGYVYFTPARPRHYRVYSRPEESFWCCVGTGMESHGRYGAFLYAHDDDGLYVNLFAPSSVEWEAKGVRLTQQTTFPDGGVSTLKIAVDTPTRFALRVRRPWWARGEAFQILVNGAAHDVAAEPTSYATIEREWRHGDEVEVRLPMAITLEPLMNREEYAAVLYGPIVLAAVTGREDLDGVVAGEGRMDHVASGALRPLDEAPMLIGERDELSDRIARTEAPDLEFTIAGAVRPDKFTDLRLVPFYRVHDARYMLYWRTATPAEYERVLAENRAAEAQRMALDRITIDRVAPGEQQSEVEHGYRGENTSTGIWRDRRYRHADGWFSYTLDTRGERDIALRLTYFGSDRRHFDILAGGELLEEVRLEAPEPDRFLQRDYPIPADRLDAIEGDALTVRFEAKPGSMAGGIFEVRLIKKPTE